MFDLNSKEFNQGGSSIFNGGVAGRVDNVTIRVEKKKPEDPDNAPDYKLYAKDETGKEVNRGFYYFSPDSSKDDEQNAKREKQEVGRVLHVAHAVVGKDYEFPSVKNSKEAFDTLFKIVRDNAGDKKFSVYVTYGTKAWPSGFLGLRYFNFITPVEQADQLRPNNADQMERVMPDQSSGSNDTATDGEAEVEDWA